MALSASTLQQPVTSTQPSVPQNNATAPLLAALVLSVYAAQKGNKQLRKLKRKAAFTLLKLKLKQSFQSLFSKKDVGGISTTTLLYILLGLIVLILLLTLPATVAIVVLLVGILLLLLTRR
ncbi:MAG: hypothetical protein JWP69_1070 [Flaviaesturariibacter sp.]|nr:hypothetical protein [Flaviaesturariibacter sp.]